MVEYLYEPDRGLLTVTVSGVVTDGDFADAKFPDVPVGTLELLDLTGTTGTEISSGEVRRIASVDVRRPERITRMAIVADQDVAYGLARMYQTLSSEMETEVRIFRDIESARAWLGIA